MKINIYLMFFTLFLTSSALTKPAKIGIYRSRSTKKLIKSDNIKEMYDNEVELFQETAEMQNINYRILGDYELINKLDNYDGLVLIFPDWDNPKIINRINQFISRGKKLIIIGNSLRKGKDFFSKLPLTCQKIKPKQFAKQRGHYFALKGKTFFTLDLIPAIRFEIASDAPQFIADIADTNKSEALAFYTNWDLNAFKSKSKFNQNSAIAQFACGASQILWIGFPLSEINPTRAIKRQIKQFKNNILHWVTGKPYAGKPFWPDAKDCVFVVSCDVEFMFENGENLAFAMKKYGIKGTYFLVGELAEKYPEVVDALADNGEIGSHSMRHEDFSKKTFQEQVDDLKESYKIIHKIGIKKIIGFRPPFEGINSDTLKALKTVGISIIYGLSDFNYSWPVIRHIQGFTIYQFPRVVLDDYNIIVDKKPKTKKDYVFWFITEVKRMLLFGGIFPFSIHSNYIAKKSMMTIFNQVIEFAMKQNLKFMPFSHIVAWVKTRKQVKVVNKADTIQIINTGKTKITDFPIVIYNYKKALMFDHYFGRTSDGGYLVKFDLKPAAKKIIKLNASSGVLPVH